MDSTRDNRLSLKIMEDTNRFLTKFIEVMLLNSKTNFKTIRFVSINAVKKIQCGNTTIINSSNISILLAIIKRCGGKTLGISKRTLRP